jgi:hypothetical protein
MDSLSRRHTHFLLSGLLPLAISVACGRAPAGSGDDTSDTSDGSATLSTDTVTTGQTDPTADTGDGDGDCWNIGEPVITQLEGPRAAADLAFDAEGNLVGSDTFSLFKSSVEGPAQLWVPGMEGRSASRYLPDGRLVYVQENLYRVMIVEADGSTSVLASNMIYPFGVAISQEGIVFVADSERIVRIDPETGDQEVWLNFTPGGARWLSFDLDYDSIFMGGGTSTIYRIPLDANGDAGEPEYFGHIPLDASGWGGDGDGDGEPPGGETTGSGDSGFSTTSGGDGDGDLSTSGGVPTGTGETSGGDPTSASGSTTQTSGDSGTGDGGLDAGETTGGDGDGDVALIDGLGVDVCGNVYVADYGTSALYRIPAQGGEGELFVDWPDWQYGHGLEWGSGLGGWSETALYLPQPYNGNKVVELELGVPGKPRVFP